MTHDWLDSVMIHGRWYRTLMGPLPYDHDGFHWRAASTDVTPATKASGHMVSGVVEDEIVARGVCADVEVNPTGDTAVLHVMPPAGGEVDDSTTTVQVRT